MSESSSQYWLDQLTDDIIQKYPEGKLVVSSGHSPSGVYHIGTLREVLTANLIAWSLRQKGREAIHLDVIDDFDAFRKVPAGVSEDYKQYIGVPLVKVPDPFGCDHASYGEHFVAQLYDSLDLLGVKPDQVLHGFELYQSGEMAGSVEMALNKLAEARQVLVEVGGRELDENWAPVQVLSDAGNLREWRFAGWDKAAKTVQWTDKQGQSGEVSLTDEPGRIKLDWRLDWPARWAKFDVTVEPFGRDHATKGGSYDTGKELVKAIFDGAAPYPVPYEFVNLVGETKKMSKSAGNVVTPADLLEVVPAEVLRYMFAKPRPGRTINFEPGIGLARLFDDYTRDKLAHLNHEPVADENALVYATSGSDQEEVSGVPFAHFVQVYQAASGKPDRVKDLLERTGYKVSDNVTAKESSFVANWLAKFAPEDVKFTVQEELPQVEVTEAQQKFLDALADKVQEAELDGQAMHEAIYAAKDEAELQPSEAFKALYRVILAKDYGPKAGWFLAALDRDWLVKRLRRQA
jgi:lysyl-tRNA synthetase class 1